MRNYIQQWGIRNTLVAGVLLAVVAMGTAMLGVPFSTSLLSIEGLVIVIGGSVANAFLSYPRAEVVRAFQAIRQLTRKIRDRRQSLHKDVMQMIMWSYVLQAKDLIGLEKYSARVVMDKLTRYGLDLVISGYAADKIREMMHTASEGEFERRCAPVGVLRNMAATAPAFGMVGTLVGMIGIMHYAGTDVALMESSMAVAMLSTLYGILAARLVCLPAADKLLREEESEHFRNYMLTEALVLLAEKQKPYYMQDRLNSFLEPAQHMELNRYVQRAFSDRLAAAA